MPEFKGLGDVLRRVVGKRQTDYVPEEETPECPKCYGSGYQTTGMKRGSAQGRANTLNMDLVPCSCRPAAYVQTFDNFWVLNDWPDLAKARDITTDWILAIGPPILILTAERGRGKSHLSKAAVNRLRENGQQVEWYTHGDIIDRLHSSFGDSGTGTLMASIGSAQWLVIDDLGQSETSKTLEGLVDRIIDLRSEAAERGCRTLYTTNLTPDAFAPRTESRLTDVRLVKAMTIDAPNYRKNPIVTEVEKWRS